MSEQTQPPENPEPEAANPENPVPDQSPPMRKTTVGGALSRISITQLTLAALVMVFLWQWLDGHRAISDMQQQLAKKIAEMDGNSKAIQILLAQEQDQVRELSGKLAALEARFAESQNQREALESLYNNLSASRDEAALAEVEQMLLTAAQQLQLTDNVRAALIAMQSADTRLQRMNRPAFAELRQVIGRDLDKLRALHVVDVTGINIQLNNLIAAVDRMPLAYQQRPANPPAAATSPARDEPSWHRLLDEIWQELKQLVRIENTEKADIPLLLPSQEYFLRENLKLSLLSSRLALLSRDQASFRQGLRTAQFWTARYFDGKSSEVAQMSDALKKLAATDIRVEIPDIGSSLQAVRNYRLTHESAPNAPVKQLRPGPPKGRAKADK